MSYSEDVIDFKFIPDSREIIAAYEDARPRNGFYTISMDTLSTKSDDDIIPSKIKKFSSFFSPDGSKVFLYDSNNNIQIYSTTPSWEAYPIDSYSDLSG